MEIFSSTELLLEITVLLLLLLRHNFPRGPFGPSSLLWLSLGLHLEFLGSYSPLFWRLVGPPSTHGEGRSLTDYIIYVYYLLSITESPSITSPKFIFEKMIF